MRLLYVLENYHPHIGGVEIVFKHLCEGMAARGHEVTVVTHRLPGSLKEEVLHGVRIVRVRSLSSRYLFTATGLPKAMRSAKNADIIHTTTYNGAFPAWVAAKTRRIPSIITVHETWIGQWRSMSDFSPMKAWMHEFLERLVYRVPRFDRYVCVSESTATALRRVLPERKGRILAIHNGFDPEDWSVPRKTESARLRRKLDLGKSFVILGYGRPGTSKGFEHLIDAFPIIKRRIPGARLVLILSTDKQYRHKVAEFKRRAHPDVLFLPPQKYKDLPAHVQMADCVVVPSLSEGFGYTVLEATAAGTPVVATRAGSIPEVIGGAHVLVTPKDPQAIADGVVRVHRKEHVKTKPKNFPWSRAIARYEKLYRELSGEEKR